MYNSEAIHQQIQALHQSARAALVFYETHKQRVNSAVDAWEKGKTTYEGVVREVDEMTVAMRDLEQIRWEITKMLGEN